METLPYELVQIILSKLSTNYLSVVRGTSTLFKSIADDIVYTRRIKFYPDIDRPLSIHMIYLKDNPPYFYAVNYNQIAGRLLPYAY